MKVNIFLPHSFNYQEKADFIVGVDYGAYLLAKSKIKMDVAIGDFDSTSAKEFKEVLKWSKKIVKLKVEKDDSDSEAAIKYVQDLGYMDINLIGDIGSRLDHFLLNCRLVEKYNITYILESGKIFNLKKGSHKIKNDYQVLSFFTSSKAHFSVTNVKYEIKDLHITYFDTFLGSNKITKDYAKVEVVSGSVNVILSNEE